MSDADVSIAPFRIDGVLEDGRLSVDLQDPSATLSVRTPEVQPLGEHDPVATLQVAGENLRLEIELTATEAKLVADALSNALLPEGFDRDA
jgi:hypothetical protein